MPLTLVEKSLLLAAYFRGMPPDMKAWVSSCDQVVTLSLFYTGDISHDDCSRRFLTKSYVSSLYDNNGELTNEIRRRYQDLITLLRSRPDLIVGGGDFQTPANPTYTSCRLTPAGDELISSIVGMFPKMPDFPNWPDKREFPAG